MNYRLDMILHIHAWRAAIKAWHFDFSAIDLCTKKIREYSGETGGIPVNHWVKGLSSKIPVSEDLDRGLEAKKRASEERKELKLCGPLSIREKGFTKPPFVPWP